MFSFVRNHQTIFQWLYCLAFSLAMNEHPVAPCPHQHVLLAVVWILAILMSVWWYLIVLICIFLMPNNVRHLLKCSFAPCMSFGEMSVQVFCPFLNWLFDFLLLSFKSYLYIRDRVALSKCDLQMFFPVCTLSFHSPKKVCSQSKSC